jgi:GTPase
MVSEPEKQRSGFVAIAGRPNVGKSTLVNRLMGTELSIVTPKPQTTRQRITGIVSIPDTQIVLVDTPGIHETEAPFNKAMVDAARKSIEESDVVLMVTTPERHIDPADLLIIQSIAATGRSAVMAINKIDTVRPPVLLPVIDAYSKLHEFHAIVPISALKGTGVDGLINILANLLPEGPPLFPEDDVSDMPVRFFVSEIIREQVMKLTGEEIPYKTAVVIESFNEKPEIVIIQANIHTERPSQKKILIGKSGAMIKKIGTAARLKIEDFLDCRVHLELFVKVSPRWTKDTRRLTEFGYKT